MIFFLNTEMDNLIRGVQASVYASLVRQKHHKAILLETTDPFLLKKRLEVFYEEEKRAKMLALAISSYQEMGMPASTGHYQYQPETDIPDREYWGCDKHGYGWNILGRAVAGDEMGGLSDKVVRFLRPLVRELVRLLERGDPLTRFFHLSVAEMRELCRVNDDDVDDDDGTTPEEASLIRDEMAFPGSLVHLVRKRYAPTLNAVLQNAVDDHLFEGACRLLSGSEVNFTKPGCRLRDNLRYLYAHNKLPLPTRLLERIEYTESRRWGENEVRRAALFVPRGPDTTPRVFRDVDDPRYSPLAPRTFRAKFCHVLEYLYFRILLDYVEHEDEAYRRIRSVSQWTRGVVEALVVTAQWEFVERQLVKCIDERVESDPWYQWVLLTTTLDIQLEVPYDGCMSFLLSRVLTRKRAHVERQTRTLCRWVSTERTVTRQDFCAYHAVRTNQTRWEGLFERVKRDAWETVQKKFFRVLYPKKSSVEEAFHGPRVQSPEAVMKRMRKELTGNYLEFLKKKKGASQDLARILYNACFPHDMFSRRPRKIFLHVAGDEFFRDVLRHL